MYKVIDSSVILHHVSDWPLGEDIILRLLGGGGLRCREPDEAADGRQDLGGQMGRHRSGGVIPTLSPAVVWKIFEIYSHQSQKLFFTNLSECFLPKFMDNSFGESNCPSGVPNSLVYGLQFVVQSGIVTPTWRS